MNITGEAQKFDIEALAKDLAQALATHGIDVPVRLPLKYGINPHQAAVAWVEKDVKVLNGKFNPHKNAIDVGAINVYDALFSGYPLAAELKEATGLPAAATIKHTSPSGAAIAKPLDEQLHEAYSCQDKELSPLATAFVRAFETDPKSAYGCIAALSDVVDVPTALRLKHRVIDGIIAPGYEPEAFNILKGKRDGNQLIMEVSPSYSPPPVTVVFDNGALVVQERNNVRVTEEIFSPVVSERTEIPSEKKLDGIVAAVAAKYTQSNTAVFAYDGQTTGVGAGQQSRVDVVRLAGQKTLVWAMRQYPLIMSMQFPKKTSYLSKLHAKVQGIGQIHPDSQYAFLQRKFADRFVVVSDSFFPFEDNVEEAAKHGAGYIVQPGRGERFEKVVEDVNRNNMWMSSPPLSKYRLFRH